MFEVRITTEAGKDLDSLPMGMRARVQHVIERLAHWPQVSGEKALRGTLKGAYRVRTGDWWVLFRVDKTAGRVTVFRIANRRDVYDE
ncbi:MAG TPA: type II toxin-antitoxin system RelE/ParE family toxin [Tepidisphaeraceae bacterium]|nr:type II toxin-antitoxin system RelE/ParE family toxin [Tepidisphaeraceae bacterium]